MTGTIPPQTAIQKKGTRKAFLDKSNSSLDHKKGKGKKASDCGADSQENEEPDVVKPVIKSKAVKKLKSDLLKPVSFSFSSLASEFPSH
jgi:hypothetical protein